METKYFKYFVVLLFLTSIIRLGLLGAFNLVPQEAYYWLYIQRPALSYFDHPPMCSYTIGLFTKLLGDNEFAVRIGMLLYSIGTSIFLFLLAKKFFKSERNALLTIIFLNLTIFFNLHSIVATPDAPLLFFWSASMYFYYKALFEDDRLINWLWGGIFAGFALSSKYTAAFIFLNLLTFFIISNQIKKMFSIKFIASLLISIVPFLPVIIWNIQNGFASFLFQTSGRTKSVRTIGFNYFFQLVASQLYELTPYFFFLLFVVVVKYIRKIKSISIQEKYLFAFTLPMVVFFFLISFTTLVKMNWILPAYLSFLILGVKYYIESEKNAKIWGRYLGFTSSIGLIALNLTIILYPIIPIEKGDSWTGWREIANRVVELKRKFDKDNRTFIFSNEYKIPAELSFYTPFKDEILAENVYGKPALQFDFWFDVRKFAGWDGIFLYSDYNPSVNLDEIQKFFEKVEFLEEYKIVKNNKIFRRFFIYHCKNYQPPSKSS